MFQKILVAMVLLLLFLSGCLQAPVPEGQDFLEGNESEPLDFVPVDDTTIPPNPAPIPGNCGAMQSQFDKDTCIFNTATQENEAFQCGNISELWQKNNCIELVAGQTQDTSLCAQMQSAYGSDNTSVKNGCISEVAKQALYTDECVQLEDAAWESNCWGKVEQICGNISEQAWKELCIKKAAIEAGDETKCLPLHGFEKATCLEEIAVSYQSQSICELIEDAEIKQSCLQRIAPGPFHAVEPITLEQCKELEGKVVSASLGCNENELDLGEIQELTASICCALE